PEAGGGGPPTPPEHRAAQVSPLLGDLRLQVLHQRREGSPRAADRLRDRPELRGDLEFPRRAPGFVVGLWTARRRRQLPSPFYLGRIPVRPAARPLVRAGQRQPVLDHPLDEGPRAHRIHTARQAPVSHGISWWGERIRTWAESSRPSA